MSLKTLLISAILAANQALASPAALEQRATHNGIATFYEQGGSAGSCGQTHSDASKIIALSNHWQKNQSPGPKCGRKIQITNTGGGQGNHGVGNVVVATVADTCPGCDRDHLDLSHGAFQALTGGKLDPPGEIEIS
ncbi:MAG: hypothetical protein Q9218_008077, partial [Villophora microphyllina]